MATAASLQVLVGADISGALKGFQQMNRTVSNAGSIFSQAAGTAAGFTAAALGMNAFAGVSGALNSAVFGLNDRLEQTGIAFTTLLGSGEAAFDFLGELQRFAAKTPFEFEGVAQSAQRLLAVGVAASDVVPLLTDIGNAAAAFGSGTQGVNSVTRALLQMKGIGVAQTGEINQLSEQGINGLQLLAQASGRSTAEIRKQLERGEISADTFIEAFQTFSRARFGGQMEKQAETFSGAMSTIKDSLGFGAARAFGPVFDAVRDLTVDFAAFSQTDAFVAFSDRIADSVAGMIRPFQDFGATVQGISRTHGLSTFDAALVATELHIRDTFGPATAAVFNGFQSAAQTAFEWLQTNGPGAFAWMQPGLIEGFMQHFAFFGRTVDNIAGDEGIGKLQATFLAIEKDIARIFGEESANVFAAFGKRVDALKLQLDGLSQSTTGQPLLGFKLIGDGEMQAIEKVAGWMNTIGGVIDKLDALSAPFRGRMVGAEDLTLEGLFGAGALGRQSAFNMPLGDLAAPNLFPPTLTPEQNRAALAAHQGRTVHQTIAIHVDGAQDTAAVADEIQRRLAEYELSALGTLGTDDQPGAF